MRVVERTGTKLKLGLAAAQLLLVPCFQAVARHRSWPGLLCPPQPRPALPWQNTRELAYIYST